MRELLLQRRENTLAVTLGEYTGSLPLSDIAPHANTWQQVYDDAVAYGRDLFENTFRHEQIRTLLATLPAQERLLSVADDPLVASIPWEYLRDQNNKLLASRLTFVRGIPDAKRRESFAFTDPLEIVAVPVSPIDEPIILSVEREWKNLVEAVRVTRPPKSLTLKRVRPPTRSQLERSLGRRCTSLVHFMGHSASHDGKAFLAFEDARACIHLVDAADFVASLNARVFLVVLNSCLSAVVAHTAFGNTARALVDRGVPYALGMQFVLPDAAALVLSEALYDFLLQDQTVEEAVMHTRRALEEPGKLSGLGPAWLAGIPVLYTSLQALAPAIELSAGHPEIQPDPVQLEKTCDLTALSVAQHFVGRSQQVSELVGLLLDPHQRGFVLLHGLGGIGKTALARVVAERLSYHYRDRVLASSFETFARLEADNRRVVDETFADRFINRVARFYGLDPKDASLYPTTVALQQAIMQRRAHVRSLLVLDNIETLVDAQQSSPAAQSLAAFVARLKEGEGAVLLTARTFPPADWGECQHVSLTGLSEEAGAALFLALLPSDREHVAPPAARKAVSRRVQGHPLGIRLLAGRFADMTATDLDAFLEHIEAELAEAEQATPTSMEDPDRQKTLYACLDYSIRRLTTEQRTVFDALSLFQAPFPADFPLQLLQDEEHTATHLQTLVRLSLLEISERSRTFQEGELILFELHPVVRWYIEQYQPEPGAMLREQYGEIYASLARQAVEHSDSDTRLRYLLYQSLPDCEAAIQYLSPRRRSTLAYHLAWPYQRLGQNRRALALYELSLEIDQELGDLRRVAVTQHAMADVLSQQGKPQEAMRLYEDVLVVYQQVGDVRSVAVTQHAMANVLSQQGKPQEAMRLYEQSLRTKQEVGDLRGVAVTQANFSQLLLQQGEQQRSLSMVWQAHTSLDEHGYTYDAQIMQRLLLTLKEQVLGPELFDSLWAQLFHDPQPMWLTAGESSSNAGEQEGIPLAQLEVIVANTVTVMTEIPEKRQEWREAMEAAFRHAQQIERVQDVEFFSTILAVLDGHIPSLPESHPYRGKLTQIQQGIAAGELPEEGASFAVSEEVMADQEGTGEDAEAEDALLFDAALISHSIVALLSSRPQEKMAYMQSLTVQMNQTTDGELKALLGTIQLALFSQNLSHLGRDLTGMYRQAWETITASVEAGGVDPSIFETIATSTLAVLGPSANQFSEWRDNLAELRNQATARGDRNMAALLDVVIGLLDAGGDSSGLGEGFKGIYARTWQTIVEGLPK